MRDKIKRKIKRAEKTASFPIVFPKRDLVSCHGKTFLFLRLIKMEDV